jgi:Domain of unknown function (DUF1905)
MRIRTTLQPRGPAAAVVLDEEQVAVIGEGARRFPVAATIGDCTWRTTVTRMGGEFLLGMSKAVREGAGAGDAAGGEDPELTAPLRCPCGRAA